MCDEAWHTWCLIPKLWYVPEDDWFCPKCQHIMLIQKLTYTYVELKAALKIKEAERKK